MSMELFNELINRAVREGFSDLHVVGGHPIVYRNNHGVINFDHRNKWTHEAVDALVAKLLTAEQLQMLRSRLSVDFARSVHRARIRINVFNSNRGLSMAIRLLPGKAPSLKNINVHPLLQQYCNLTAGLILICGTTGCGKSTTIAAMIEEINSARATHIITLEDPIEYRFVSKRSFIEQRELGMHMSSFEQGLIDVLRENPDVIVVGELREPQVMRLTLDAAESGHLVIASLHSSSSEEALYRICNAFPLEAQDAVRSQLSASLSLLVIQQLVYLEHVGFRVPQLSILRNTQAVKSIIRDNKLSQIESAMQTGKGSGMFTMESYRTDYLDLQHAFASPMQNFRPSEEITSEVIYQSPLIDPQAAFPVSGAFPLVERRRSRDRRRAPDQRPSGTAPQEVTNDARTPLAVEDTDQHYVIEDNINLEELISQLDRK